MVASAKSSSKIVGLGGKVSCIDVRLEASYGIIIRLENKVRVESKAIIGNNLR